MIEYFHYLHPDAYTGGGLTPAQVDRLHGAVLSIVRGIPELAGWDPGADMASPLCRDMADLDLLLCSVIPAPYLEDDVLAPLYAWAEEEQRMNPTDEARVQRFLGGNHPDLLPPREPLHFLDATQPSLTVAMVYEIVQSVRDMTLEEIMGEEIMGEVATTAPRKRGRARKRAEGTRGRRS